ncbi:MAG: GNAT family N-acetyltransferase [Thiobacillaceae bacterium]
MIGIRPATAADLPAINRVVERAVMTWRLPERVKRLALPSYRYHTHDLDHQRMLVAVAADADIVGVAALEEADPRDLPVFGPAQLLHGLYVDPEWHGRGIGTRLIEAALAACGESACRGLLVKAQPDAVGFFQARGLERLPVRDPDRDYPHRYWAPVASCTQPSRAGTRAATRV